MDYNSQHGIDATDKSRIETAFNGMLTKIKHVSVSMVMCYLTDIPLMCRMSHNSINNSKKQHSVRGNPHPVRPKQGDIFYANITHGVGCELCDGHLVLVVQNDKANAFSSKVNVVPIEGDGTNVQPYNHKLTNTDMLNGHIDKDPSRLIVTDIMTLDKARLERKIGTVKPEYLKEVKGKIAAQLDM